MHPASAAERVDGLVVQRHFAKARIEAVLVAGGNEGVGEQIEVEGASDGNPFEVGDADGRPPAEGVGPQRDHARLHGAERHEPDAGALVGSVHEAEVDGFFLQGVQDGGIGHLERGDGAPRRAVDELVDERHRFVTLVEK